MSQRRKYGPDFKREAVELARPESASDRLRRNSGSVPATWLGGRVRKSWAARMNNLVKNHN